MCYRAPPAKKENEKEKVKHFLDLNKISSLHNFLKWATVLQLVQTYARSGTYYHNNH